MKFTPIILVLALGACAASQPTEYPSRDSVITAVWADKAARRCMANGNVPPRVAAAYSKAIIDPVLRIANPADIAFAREHVKTFTVKEDDCATVHLAGVKKIL